MEVERALQVMAGHPSGGIYTRGVLKHDPSITVAPVWESKNNAFSIFYVVNHAVDTWAGQRAASLCLTSIVSL